MKPAAVFCFCKATPLTAKPFGKPESTAVPVSRPVAGEIERETPFEPGIVILLLAPSVTLLVTDVKRLPPEQASDPFPKPSAGEPETGGVYLDPTTLMLVLVNPGL